MLVICKHLGEVIKVMKEQKVTLALPCDKLECKQCDYRWNEDVVTRCN